MSKLHYGHKERHGSAFLTSFVLDPSVDIEAFVEAVDTELRRETRGLTNVRLTDTKEKSKSGLPILTVWWGGDTGSYDDDRPASRLGGAWFVQDYYYNALRKAGEAQGVTEFVRLGHSCEADSV